MNRARGARWLLKLASVVGAASTAAAMALAEAPPVQAAGVAYTTGDVFAGVGTGLIKHFSSAGVLLDTLNTGTGCNEDLGMAFDASNNLYATAAFGSCGTGTVSKFDNMGNLIGPFGGPYSSSTESITIDAAGHVFVGQPDGTKQVVENSSTGALVADFSPATQDRGTDWIDLAADQCTLFYTSEGNLVKRFNVCTNTQLTDFATTPSGAGTAYALRIRPNGDIVVAASNEVVRFNSSGAVVQIYPLPAGESSFLFALNLDPDGTSFWTAGYFSGNVYRIDLTTGAIITSFNAAPFTRLSGLAVAGEIRVAIDNTPPTCTLTAVIAGPPKQIQITIQDSDGGLKSIVVVSSSNATTTIPSFTVGTTSAVVVTSTKINQTLGSTVSLKATDMAGNVVTCDPTLVDGTTGRPTRTTVDGSEGHVLIANNGLNSLTIEVNGRTFTLRGISGQTNLTLDISSALHAGSNSVTIHGRGPNGSNAVIVFSS